ncbi:MAG: 3-dehydroquinate synthase [Clostridia bacterium]|nr:3-dehydroquinate synthase [Clostridia bacterium]
MTVVSVPTGNPYEVLIGGGLLDSLGSHTAELRPKARVVCLVSDTNVWPLYGQQTQKSLEDAGLTVYPYIIQAGEQSKCGAVWLELLGFMAEHKLTRTDLMAALGGGVVGDLTGFAAATYLRGIDYIQIPTTLLAAVDSSVGGKTAIDLPRGKNLVGAFHQPILVLCDTDTLHTLPADIFLDGCAEVIKYGILYDADLFDHLEQYGPAFDREAVITRCIECKRDVVVLDERDTGLRMKLNLGHTIGHAVESLSDYTLSHGKSVAIGTAIIARASAACGHTAPDVRNAILHILNRFGLPTHTAQTAAALTEAALSDKKRSGGTIRLILPREIGDCFIHPLPAEDLEDFIKKGL